MLDLLDKELVVFIHNTTLFGVLHILRLGVSSKCGTRTAPRLADFVMFELRSGEG